VDKATLKQLVVDILADKILGQPQHILSRVLRYIITVSFAQDNSLEPPRCLLLPSVPGEETSDALERLQQGLLLLLLLLLLLICSDKPDAVAEKPCLKPSCTLLAALALHPA
jgi:hypothetical protein